MCIFTDRFTHLNRHTCNSLIKACYRPACNKQKGEFFGDLRGGRGGCPLEQSWRVSNLILTCPGIAAKLNGSFWGAGCRARVGGMRQAKQKFELNTGRGCHLQQRRDTNNLITLRGSLLFSYRSR